MKTVVIGDIHGRDIWKTIVDTHKDADRFVFLGDYVSTYDDISDEEQINNLLKILEFAETENMLYDNRVVLLRGNHDIQHLGYHWGRCSGLNSYVQSEMMKFKDKFLTATKWIFVEDDIVYSHAGISTAWMNNVGLDDISKINDMEPTENFAFWPCKLSDYTGDSVTQPPIWIRPWTLFSYSFGKYTYVVGHTKVKSVYNLKNEMLNGYKASYHSEDCPLSEETIRNIEANNDVWLCDSLPNEYLVIEDGNFIPFKL